LFIVAEMARAAARTAAESLIVNSSLSYLFFAVSFGVCFKVFTFASTPKVTNEEFFSIKEAVKPLAAQPKK